jgi:predicted lipid-binding transport protein (Tim44 family)
MGSGVYHILLPNLAQMTALNSNWQPSFDAEESLGRVVMALNTAEQPATAEQYQAIKEALDADL